MKQPPAIPKSSAYLCALCGSRPNRRERRGVLLLLMLSLLVLFAALGVTYVLVASQYRKTSAVQPRLDQYAPDYRNQLDEVAMQIFRGSNNPRSVLSIHSLLEDMYGNDGLSSDTTNITISVAANAVFNPTTGLPSTQPPQLVDLTLINPNITPNPGANPPIVSGVLPWPMGQYYTPDGAVAGNPAGNPMGSPATQPTQPITGPPPYVDPAVQSGNVKPNANSLNDTKSQTIIANPTIAPSGYFNGCVLTFTSGPAAGQSTRIVGYDNGLIVPPGGPALLKTNSTGTPTLRVMAFPGAGAMISESQGLAAGSTGLQVKFVINGRPFNGTGFGFNAYPTNPAGTAPNPSFGLVNASDDPKSVTTSGTGMYKMFALLPNPAYFSTTNPITGNSNPWYTTSVMYANSPHVGQVPVTATTLSAYNQMTPTMAGGFGGADEGYDAADWNNMLLALPYNPRLGAGKPYPSLHRPELVNFWINATHTTGWSSGANSLVAKYPSLARQIVMRPLVSDHPNFTGSNPNTFDPANYVPPTLDVDNDGDGVTDSIWVDGGLKVQTAPDGTMYKPLVAIKMIDLDNRLNVNAHGNSAQTEAMFGQPPTANNPNFAGQGGPQTAPPTPPGPPGPGNNGGGVTSPNPAPIIGSGYGTAEVNLFPLYNQGGANTAPVATLQMLYQSLLAGTPPTANGSQIEGRYGESQSTLTPTGTNTELYAAPTTAAPIQPSATTLPYPGNTLSSGGPSGNYSQLTASALGLIKHWEFPLPGVPTNPANFLVPTAYGSAPDLWGRGFVALDGAGNPTMPMMSNQPYPFANAAGHYYPGLGGQNDTLNNPYLLNLSRNTAVRGALQYGATDNPFSPAELERLLRVYDMDAGSLPSRLASLLDPSSTLSPPTGSAPLGTWIKYLRQQVTTDSWDLPSPSILTPTTTAINFTRANTQFNTQFGLAVPNLRQTLPLAGSVADLLAARLPANFGGTHADLNLRPGQPYEHWGILSTQLQLMLAPDLMAGQRFDINRPLGNGRDDDGDGIVDEPDEYYLGEPAWLIPNNPPTSPVTGYSPFPSMGTGSGASPVNLAIDWTGDGNINAADAIMARQLMARYLYVLATLLVEPRALSNSTGVNSVPNIVYDLDTANIYQTQYALAQWAINTVDFRDRDSIMTPFEFDLNPLDGWSVDGVVGVNPATGISDDSTNQQRALVWGCERPELLITETLAWHDRRTEDLPNDNGVGKVVGAPTDTDYDQRLLPYPACFIELYNPWTTPYSMRNATAMPADAVYTPSPAEIPGELYYNPTPLSATPGQVYGNPNGNAPLQGVALDKVAYDPNFTATGGTAGLPPSPVWRMIFVKNGSTRASDPRTLDPDDPYANSPQGVLNVNASNFALKQTGLQAGASVPQTNDVERAVYFVPATAWQGLANNAYKALFTTPSGLSNTATGTLSYCTSMPVSPIKPGRYGVVGSLNQIVSPGTAGVTAASSRFVYMSQVGRVQNATDTTTQPTTTRRVVLAPHPAGNPEVNQVWSLLTGQSPNDPPPINVSQNDPSPLNGVNANPSNVHPAIAIVVDTFLDSSTGNPYPNASAPTNVPTARFFAISDPPTPAGYTAYNTTQTPQLVGTQDEYQFPQPNDKPFDSPAAALGADGVMMLNQTTFNYRTVHLQRLADPTMPYNPPPTDPLTGRQNNPAYPVNIYLTVDSASIDVTSFNGLTPKTGTADPQIGAGQLYQVWSTQRGDQDLAQNKQANQPALLWAHGQPHGAPGTASSYSAVVPHQNSAPNNPDGPGLEIDGRTQVATHNFNWIMHSSLGYLNWSFGQYIDGASLPAGLTPAYAGALQSAGNPVFSWLTWNNRPYVSPMELALVPKSRSSRLTFDYCSTAAAPAPLYLNDGTPPGASGTYAALTQPNYFGHLLNFFDGGTANTATNPPIYYNAGGQVVPGLSRLLEYVQVPSKFVGTDTILPPSNNTNAGTPLPNQAGFTNGQISNPGANTQHSTPITASTMTLLNGDAVPGTPRAWNNIGGAPKVVPYGLGSTPFGTLTLPPYNRIPEYREPGRVNINTLLDPPTPGGGVNPGSVIWQGIENGTTSPQLATSANGAAVLPTVMYWPNNNTNTPSYFTNPFQSAAGAALLNSVYADPTVNMFGTGVGAYTTLRDVDATLMRPAVRSEGQPFTQTAALFDSPGLIAGSVQPYNDPTRNAYFRLQNVSRMSNLVTGRSNVYAVWITVGYFQVTPWRNATTSTTNGVTTVTANTTGPVVYDTAHPDGYQLGLELGSDTGDVKRHRAFYLFDRTIPVGFERGVDHNVQNAILLKRFIE